MSGAVAAHAAYNGSGTQGLAVTNKIRDDDGDVMSVFWNSSDTTRQLLYGSAVVEIPGSGGSGTLTADKSNHQIFDVNNDIDCLGDLFLRVQFDSGDDTIVTPEGLAACVTRVEIMVGTQIWQTFEQADLQAMAATELEAGAFQDYAFQTSGGLFGDNFFRNGIPDSWNELSNGERVIAFIPLKLFTKTLGPRLENFSEMAESGYLMAAAPHQQVKVKVFTQGPSAETKAMNASSNTISLNLYGKNQVMCNEEREQMKAMPMGLPKRIKMTQNASKKVATSMDIDLDHFSLYASHIIVSVKLASGKVPPELYPGTAELLLNSSSYSGKLPLGLLKMTGPSMGLSTNEYFYNNLNKSNFVTFVFPLASRAYGGSSVPLNRFDNIRLKLVLPSGIPDTAENVNVTCVGETTALYKGGAASLAMY